MKGIRSVAFLALFLILSGTTADARRLPPNPKKKLDNSAGTLIVGGRDALQGEAPYQLTLKVSYQHFCGASLVEVDGLQIGITAAHCVDDDFDAGYYDVVAGDINFADETGLERRLHVDRIVVHQNFTDTQGGDDIALLFLNDTFVLNDNIQTIPLPPAEEATPQGNLTVSGWGRLSFMGPMPDELQIVELPAITDDACKLAFENTRYNVTKESMICTGIPEGDLSSPCNADSGGPTISEDGYLVGIVSWSYEGCGILGYPTVYTRVSNYIGWIHNTVANYKNSH